MIRRAQAISKRVKRYFLSSKQGKFLLGSVLFVAPRAVRVRSKYVKRLKRKKLISQAERRRGVIFIHIPKTGGVSITRTLFGEPVGHRTILEIALHDPEFYASCDSFAVVRNPWDRFVSAYSYLAQGGMGDQDRKMQALIEDTGSFSGFVHTAWADKRFRKQVLDHVHFRPQYQFVCSLTGRVLVSFVGRFEQFNEATAIIASAVGHPASIDQLNASARGSYRDYYDSETRTMIGKLYARDIQLFDYNF